jgi:hypothetical protein
MPITSSCEDTLGFEFVAIGDFKISAVIDLTADVAVRGDNSLDFAILSGADANKFTLKGNELTFEATDFEARSDVAYRVKVQATFTSAVRSITLAVFSGVEKLEAVVIDNANVWNDDNNSILAINNFTTFIENS